MKLEFEHPDYGQTVNYRLDWVRPTDPATVVHTQTVSRTQWGALAGTTPTRYQKSGAFTKPSPLTGEFLIRVTAINAVGESPVAESASFQVSAPGAVSNIGVIDPHL